MSQQSVSSDVTNDDKLWAALGYPIGLIALVMLFLDEKKGRPFIKFHAVQALAVNGLLGVVIFVFSCILTALTFFIAGLGGILPLVLWLALLWPAYEAYSGKYLEIP